MKPAELGGRGVTLEHGSGSASYLLVVFLLVLWRLVIGLQGFLILVGKSILVVRVYIEFFLTLAGLISGFSIII